MSNGTPEQDLNTYMDNQDQQQAELDQEYRYTEDFCDQVESVIESVRTNWLDTESCIWLDSDRKSLSIEISMTDREYEMFVENLKNESASAYVIDKVEECE
jgi:hypothetical protein